MGNARSQELSVIDVAAWRVERALPIDGDNLRQVAFGPDGRQGYVANMKNRGFATTANNIDLGWVLGQRLTRVDVGGEKGFETLSLDPSGRAVADVHGVAVGGDGRYLAVACGGTHEVLLLRVDAKRPLEGPTAVRDLIAGELLSGGRPVPAVPVGGRPTELAFAPDARTLYVANYLADAVQVVRRRVRRVDGDDPPWAAPPRFRSPGGGAAVFHRRDAVVEPVV